MASPDSGAASFAGADADALGQLGHKDLAVADGAGMGPFGDGG